MSITLELCLGWVKPLWQTGHSSLSTLILRIIVADLLWRVNQQTCCWYHPTQHTNNIIPLNPIKCSSQFLIRICLFGCEPSDQTYGITLTWPITQKELCLDTGAWGGSLLIWNTGRGKKDAWGAKIYSFWKAKTEVDRKKCRGKGSLFGTTGWGSSVLWFQCFPLCF